MPPRTWDCAARSRRSNGGRLRTPSASRRERTRVRGCAEKSPPPRRRRGAARDSGARGLDRRPSQARAKRALLPEEALKPREAVAPAIAKRRRSLRGGAEGGREAESLDARRPTIAGASEATALPAARRRRNRAQVESLDARRPTMPQAQAKRCAPGREAAPKAGARRSPRREAPDHRRRKRSAAPGRERRPKAAREAESLDARPRPSQAREALRSGAERPKAAREAESRREARPSQAQRSAAPGRERAQGHAAEEAVEKGPAARRRPKAGREA